MIYGKRQGCDKNWKKKLYNTTENNGICCDQLKKWTKPERLQNKIRHSTTAFAQRISSFCMELSLLICVKYYIYDQSFLIGKYRFKKKT